MNCNIEVKCTMVLKLVCIISIPKLINRLFRSSNLFDYVNLIPKLANLSFRYSNSINCLISVPKLVNQLLDLYLCSGLTTSSNGYRIVPIC